MTGPMEEQSHPAPHRHKVSALKLFAGLLIPPLAWAIELLVSFGISSNACPLTQGQTSRLGFQHESVLLLGVQVICLGAVTGSGLMSRRHWLTVRGEKTDSEHSHVTLGEGRTRFVALGAMLTAVTFAIAILFNLLEPIVIPSCWTLR